jgi:apolipoprotein D and lipocalin family protein
MLRLVLPVPMVIAALAALVVALGGCGSSQREPVQSPTLAPLEPVAFRPSRYAGTWYEIARLDHPEERGLSDVTVEYRPGSLNSIEITTRGWDATQRRWREWRGNATFTGYFRTGSLEVDFERGRDGTYKVLAIDPQQRPYPWAMAGSDDRTRLWILAREPRLDAAMHERLVAQARALGFPVDKLIHVVHGQSPKPAPAQETAQAAG